LSINLGFSIAILAKPAPTAESVFAFINGCLISNLLNPSFLGVIASCPL
jgi:hypothetical protein